MNILRAIEEIIASCESWLPAWSTDRFAVAVVIRSVDKNNTTVCHLSREFSHLLLHFLTHGGEMNAEGDGSFKVTAHSRWIAA